MLFLSTCCHSGLYRQSTRPLQQYDHSIKLNGIMQCSITCAPTVISYNSFKKAFALQEPTRQMSQLRITPLVYALLPLK